MKNKYAVLDFETTGLDPLNGDRITEVGIVIVEGLKVVDQYQSLVKTGAYIPGQVQSLTGITNQMVATAPDVNTVLLDMVKFVGATPLVAHNASFDRKFWNAEFERIGVSPRPNFLCTLLMARRLYQQAENHKLITLANYLSLGTHANSHRALADAEVTANLFIRMMWDLNKHHPTYTITHSNLLKLQKDPISNFSKISTQIQKEKLEVTKKQNVASENKDLIKISTPKLINSVLKPKIITEIKETKASPSYPSPTSEPKNKNSLWDNFLTILGLTIIVIIALGVVFSFPLILIPIFIVWLISNYK